MARVSISIGDSELKWLRAWAQTHHRGSLSAAIADVTQFMRERDAMRTSRARTKTDGSARLSHRAKRVRSARSR